MTRMSLLSHPMFLGFEEMERLLDRASKGTDGYPPYNIERLPATDGDDDRLRITLAVAGFRKDQLEVVVEDRQLIVRGRQTDDDDVEREYLHRGIAARQFQRAFVLADGIEIQSAELANGLLAIDLVRITPEKSVQRIDIGERG